MIGRNLPSLPGFFMSMTRPMMTSVNASTNRISRNMVPIAAPEMPTTLV